ncbi:MAG: glycosyltransferase [Thermomicrobiales bacterium]
MRVLFTTQPVPSHLYPLVPLASALASAGHDVAFATAPSFSPSVAAAGFRAFPAGMDFLPGQVDIPLGRVQAGGDPAHAHAVLAEFFGWATAQRMTPDVLTLCRTWQPDLIVRDPVEFGGCLAAECLGLPHLTGRENRFLPPARWRAYLGAPLARLRRAHGLPPDPELAMLYRYLGLAWAPPWFVTAAGDRAFGSYIGPTMHFLRPVPFDRSGPETLPAWVQHLPGRPTVYATLGTVFNDAPAVFAAILAALRDEPVNLIVTVGRNQDPAWFGPQPGHVHIERYIPQTLLAPHCDAVISAGGFGTVMTCLAFGLPMVVLPLGADQPVNARRCVALGVGRVVSPEERTPDRIRRALRTALHDPRYRTKAARLGAEMAALPGPAHAVALLERLAVERRPIVAA